MMIVQKVGLLISVALVVILGTTNVSVAEGEGANVTLHIFSGRPDPVWPLSTGEAQAFRRILDTLPPGEASTIPDNLGYRGFEVHLGEETAYVYDGYVQLTPNERWLADPGHALEIWLLGTAGEALEPDLVVLLWTQFTQLHQANSSAGEGFAIYLVAGDVTPTEAAHAELSTLERQPDPVIQMEDIIVYHAATHEFELTAGGMSRLEALQVPVSGIPFVVCVDGEPIYPGAFWASYSSLSYYESIVLDVFRGLAGLSLSLDLGYPASPELYTGEDLRSDSRILAAFERAGKLD